ncbi:FadR/GntR family transcriptional regulator [Streptomyces bohaiensis]|uniref:FadR family transcriptional regulator n=1 Tax=Streptomyces bohaiensis TaxID=1431344 RepID=A0ABX1C9M7_9ACTN|nr:FCD domain-containing protein [Streptomyces bohaiensis]NJQ14778.1 FadR family transcriptional regulator [Streptomyces bohaiensis]
MGDDDTPPPSPGPPPHPTDPTGGDTVGAPPGAAALLGPVRADSGFEEVLERLLRTLRLGLVGAGERLPPERELARLLGVSRATLREVLEVLRAQGLVVSRRGRYGGTFVAAAPARGGAAPPGGVDVADTLRLREVLDVGAAELCAAQGLRVEETEQLREVLEGTAAAPPSEYRRADTRFHLTLAALTGSPSLSAHYAQARASLNVLLDGIPLLERNLEHSQRQHARVVAAVLAGDAPAAGAAMREHCAGTAALLRGFLT